MPSTSAWQECLKQIAGKAVGITPECLCLTTKEKSSQWNQYGRKHFLSVCLLLCFLKIECVTKQLSEGGARVQSLTAAFCMKQELWIKPEVKIQHLGVTFQSTVKRRRITPSYRHIRESCYHVKASTTMFCPFFKGLSVASSSTDLSLTLRCKTLAQYWANAAALLPYVSECFQQHCCALLAGSDSGGTAWGACATLHRAVKMCS